MKLRKLLSTTLLMLFFVNVTSVFGATGLGIVNTVQDVIRIFLYLFILFQIGKYGAFQSLKNSYLYKFCFFVPIVLFFSISLSLLDGNTFVDVAKRIFSTYFLLADNLLFLLIGCNYYNQEEGAFDYRDYLWWFAALSIIWMSLVTGFVKIVFGDLEQLWNSARDSGGLLDEFLGVYKNANPYKFAVLASFLFVKKTKWNICLVITCVINILLAGKRGPLVGASVAMFIIFLFGGIDKKKYIKYLLGVSILFAIVYFVVDNTLLDTLIYRMDASQHYGKDNDTSFYLSGRDNIWYIILNNFDRSDIFSQLFGHGVLGARNILLSVGAPGNAHNTWLEILYNFGIVGCIVYMTYYISLLKLCFRLKRMQYEHYLIAIYCVIFSLTSTSFTVTYTGGFAAPAYAGLAVFFFYGHSYRYNI